MTLGLIFALVFVINTLLLAIWHQDTGGGDALEFAHQIELGDQRGAHFARLGMTTERLLRENQFAVDFDFEDAAGRRY